MCFIFTWRLNFFFYLNLVKLLVRNGVAWKKNGGREYKQLCVVIILFLFSIL